VPQNSDDESATELLKRIQLENERFIRVVKIEKEKTSPSIAEDEAPYDLPAGWIWVKLDNLGDVRSSKRVFTSEFVSNGIPFYRGTEIGALANDQEIAPKYYITEEHYRDLINCTGKPAIGDLLMPSICPDGRVWLIDTEESFYFKDGRVLWIHFTSNCINNRYIQQALKARLLGDYVNIASGTTFAELKIFLLKNIAIPLPPLAEQQRIVAKVDELMALCNKLEAAEKDLDALGNHLIEYLPKSILQAAVQGKLVPQNPYDEPATELLKRIQQKKTRLVKEGKIKKEKPLPPITEDEIPYDLPDGWVWCRLGDVILKNIGGGTPSKQNPEYWNGNIPWASVKDLNCDVLSSTIENITPIGLQNSTSNLITAGNIIVCTRIGLGKIAVNEIEVAINQDLRALYLEEVNLDKRYFIYFYKAQEIVGNGMTVKGITIDELHTLLFPLPPLAEQQRIVAKVDELMAMCGELNTARTLAVESMPSSVLQFPQKTAIDNEGEEIAMAARGDATSGLSEQALRDVAELFGDEVDE
jgi:type I restriction enzyme S subunit